jgi:hypothetical protein
MKRTLAVLATLLVLPVVALAQKPVTQTEATELTTKIEAIDKTARLVTLKDKDGETETIYCGPEVKRFDELKVGDTITVRTTSRSPTRSASRASRAGCRPRPARRSPADRAPGPAGPSRGRRPPR